MKKKTCFVISPIGAKDSQTRKLADDLFDLIIEPALEKFDFDIIRADKITTSSSITTDIIHHVQNSDLCIVDLTGRNPNVMYECGRRHETGKPFIMVALDGEELPFDINTIRTFFYNTNDGRAIREVTKVIQDVVRNLISEGFAPQTSGESLSTISDSLRRIERKLDDVIEKRPIVEVQSGESEGSLEILKQLNPTEAYAYALRVGDYKLAGRILPFVLENIQDIETAILICTPMADESEVAAKVLEENLLKINPRDTEINWLMAFNHLMHFWAKYGFAKSKLPKAIEFTEYFLPYARNNEERANILNQLSRIYYSADEYEKSMSIAEEVVSLWRETSYLYNLALIYRDLDMLDKSYEMIQEMIEMGTTDSDHLELAVKIFRKLGDTEKANETLLKLREVNRYKAEMLDLMDF